MVNIAGPMDILRTKPKEEAALLLNTFIDLIMDYEGKREKFEIIVSAGDVMDEISFHPESGLLTEEDDDTIFVSSIKTIDSFVSIVEMKNIIKINDMSTMEDVINLVEAVRDNDSIFGVLLTNGHGDYLNPAHPIVAKIIKEKEITHWFPNGFTALVFPISKSREWLWEQNSKTFNAKDPYIVDDMKEEEIHKVSIEGLPNISQFYPENIYTNIRTILEKIEIGLEEEKESVTPVMIPVQIMQKSGIAYPWYGAVWVENGRKNYGVDLGPMFSANLSANTSVEIDEEDVGYEDYKFAICTGDLPVGFTESLGVLNTSNYDSQYKEIIGDFNVIDIKEKMAKQSVKIYKENI